TRLAAVAEAGITIFDLASRTEIVTLQRAVDLLAFSADGTMLLGASGNSNRPVVEVWDTRAASARARSIRAARELDGQTLPKVQRIAADVAGAADSAQSMRADTAVPPEQRRSLLNGLLHLTASRFHDPRTNARWYLYFRRGNPPRSPTQ